MANKNYSIVVGLDIGTAFTKVVVCKLYEDNIEILGLSETKTEGISGGNITNLFKLEETISGAIISAEDSAGIDIKSVNIVIFGNYIKIGKYHCSTKVTNYNGIITKNDVNKLFNDISNVTTQPNCKILNVVPVFYSTDSIKNVSDPVGMISTNLTGEYNVIYAQSSVLKQFTESFNNCDLEVDSIISTPEALANVILSKDEKELGTCIIDMGGGSTEISIFKNNSIQNVVSIPFGGNSITNDLKVAFGLTFEQAEKLKLKYGEALLRDIPKDEVIDVVNANKSNSFKIYKYDIVQVINARILEILKMASNELLKQKIVGLSQLDLHLIGGCAKIKNICQLIGNTFGGHCRIANLNGNYKFLEIDSRFFHCLGAVVATNKEREEESKFENVQFSKNSIGKGGFFKNIITKTKKFLID